MLIFSPWGGNAVARRAASEPSARSSGCGRVEAPLEEPWTSPTAVSAQWRAARAELARASYQAPPPGKGAVGSGGETDDEDEEVEVAIAGAGDCAGEGRDDAPS